MANDPKTSPAEPKESVLTDKLDQTAAEYGRLSYQTQNLRKEKESLSTAVTDLTKQKDKLEEDVDRLEKDTKAKIQKNKELENARLTKAEEKEAVLAERESRTVFMEQETKRKKTEVEAREKESIAAEENLNSSLKQIETRKTELKEQEKTIKEEQGVLKEEKAEVKRLRTEQQKDRDAVEAQRTDLEREKKNFESQKKSLESIRDGNKSEAQKLDTHMAQVRADMEKNNRLKAYIDRKMPKLERLVRAGTEIREYILNHVNNPDAIANKVNLTFKELLPDAEKDAPKEDVPA